MSVFTMSAHEHGVAVRVELDRGRQPLRQLALPGRVLYHMRGMMGEGGGDGGKKRKENSIKRWKRRTFTYCSRKDS